MIRCLKRTKTVSPVSDGTAIVSEAEKHRLFAGFDFGTENRFVEKCISPTFDCGIVCPSFRSFRSGFMFPCLIFPENMLSYLVIFLQQTEADMVSRTTKDPSRQDGARPAVKSHVASAQISLFMLIAYFTII